FDRRVEVDVAPRRRDPAKAPAPLPRGARALSLPPPASPATHTPRRCARCVDRLTDRRVDPANVYAVESDRFAPRDRAENRELCGGIGAAQIVRRITLGEALALRIRHGIGERPLLLEAPEHVGRRA